MTDRLKGIQGNWEYERCIKPEDVDYLLERVEELEFQQESLREKRTWDRKRMKEYWNENKRYKQALENIEELWANREFNDNLAWDMLLESRQALKGESQ
ncbi:hypothetical protein [Oceanobacillus alkalisoli]|uniref:hypothetical protein n=1 Tax=Oceanobacillus alkalisoli TaxID=2925113 RepID=UPI001EE3CA31|nr:hypothetical protein [Oceanobacillus alkalisoli]MCG5104422.1 hypothetical protein [Oceanobacillus alkalisoli]